MHNEKVIFILKDERNLIEQKQNIKQSYYKNNFKNRSLKQERLEL